MLNKIQNLLPLIISLFTVSLVSCSASAAVQPTPEDMVVPGDKIGEMVITAVDVFQGDNHLGLYCPDDWPEVAPNTREVDCEAYPGDQIQVDCLGWWADSIEELDELWPTSTWRLTIDDQVIDLPAFGTAEAYRSDINKHVRFWNVLIEAITPGTHVIVCEETVGDEHFTARATFSVPEHARTYPPLPKEGVPGQHAYTSEESQLNLWLFLPDDYGKDPQQKWPLILYLHGSDRRGHDLERLKDDPLIDVVGNRSNLPFIVVSPQLSGKSDQEFWRMEDPTKAVLKLLDEVQSKYAVDPQRVYLTGASNGGGGVWEIGLAFRERFAALVPVMGYYGWPWAVPENICELKEVPVWAFHGAEDEMIPLEIEQDLVDALEACGGNVRFTVYPDRGHDIDNLAYREPELFDWLLAQKRN